MKLIIATMMLFLSFATPVQAMPGRLVLTGTEQWPVRLDDKVLLYEDPSGKLTFEEAARLPSNMPDGFLPATPASLHPGVSPSAWWMQIALSNHDSELMALRLLQGTQGLRNVDYFVQSQGQNSWRHIPMGDAVPLSAHAADATRIPSLGITLRPGESVRILARIQTDRPFWLKPMLFSQGDFYVAQSRLTLWEGVHLGGLLALAWCALLIALWARSREFALLSVLSLIITAYEASIRGYTKFLFWPESTEWAHRSAPVLGYLSMAVFLVFAMSMARLQKIRWPLPGYFIGLAIALGSMSIASLVGNLFWLSKLSTFILALTAASIAAAAFMLFKRSAPTRGLMLLIASFVLLQTGMRIAQRLGALPDSLNDLAMGSLADNPAVAIYGLAVNLAVLTGWIVLIGRQRVQAQRELNAFQEQEQERLKAEVAKQTQALSKALEYADLKNRQKTEALGYIGHDLRAPLATIVGYARLLRSQPELSTSEPIQAIERSARYQLTLIDDLLHLARNELQPLEIQPSTVDLLALLDDLVQHAAMLSAQRHNDFRALGMTELPVDVVVDARRLQQVLLNLLSNAAKFTRGGAIELAVGASVAAGRARLQFTVSDSGIGIAPEKQSVIFDAFSRVQSRGSGVGLGLFIAQRLIEGMGGQLRVESTPGEGSRFSFQLDVTVVSSRHQAWRASLPAVGNSRHVADATPDTATPAPPAHQRIELADFARSGRLSDIEAWLRDMALQHPGCERFYDQVRSALHILDFEHIESLALRP